MKPDKTPIAAQEGFRRSDRSGCHEPGQSLCNILAGGLGMGLFFMMFFRDHWLVHKVRLPWTNRFIEAVTGTYGPWSFALNSACGVILYSLVWWLLFTLSWVKLGRGEAVHTAAFVGRTMRWLGLLIIPAVLATVARTDFIPVIWGMGVVIILWTLGRWYLAILSVPAASFQDQLPPVLREGLVTTALGVLLVGLVGGAWLNNVASAEQNVVFPNNTCVLTFDAEEDWWAADDALQANPQASGSFYFDSFNYVSSGVLKRLANGLAQRGIKATFYCTPGFAIRQPESVLEIESLGHEIGVHLHVHNVLPVKYPYASGSEMDLSAYPWNDKKRMISSAKEAVEGVVGHKTKSFRSGQWSCDGDIEEVCRILGFESISNHTNTYRLPNGLWQMAVKKDYDVLKQPRTMLVDFARKMKRPSVIPLFSHPTTAYDYATGRPQFEVLDEFFQKIDQIHQRYPLVHFQTTSDTVSQLALRPPSLAVRTVILSSCFLTFGLILILSARTPRAAAKSRAELSAFEDSDEKKNAALAQLVDGR